MAYPIIAPDKTRIRTDRNEISLRGTTRGMPHDANDVTASALIACGSMFKAFAATDTRKAPTHEESEVCCISLSFV